MNNQMRNPELGRLIYIKFERELVTRMLDIVYNDYYSLHWSSIPKESYLDLCIRFNIHNNINNELKKLKTL